MTISLEGISIIKTSFDRDKVLEPLTSDEKKSFLGMLLKLSNHTDEPLNKQILSIYILDLLHRNHTSELSSIVGALMNKLVTEPFAGDRDILKSVLESIMKGVSITEKLKDEEGNST